MKPVAFDYERPTRLEAALLLLGDGREAKLLAGGQSLGPMLNLRLAAPELLVDVAALRDLREVTDERDAVVLGATTTHAEIEDGVVPDPSRGMMRFVARDIAYRAVRNRGTLGGSLAHADSSGDWVSAIAALDGEILAESAKGSRRIAIGEFFLGPLTTALRDDEVLRAVRVPRLSARARWGYYKICRKTGEFAHAMGAAVIDPERGVRRLVVGATGAAPSILDGGDGLLGELFATPTLELAERAIAGLGLGLDPIAIRLHAAAVRRALDQARGGA
jgi:carbon-monoxide dehydrogenase medium subunit